MSKHGTLSTDEATSSLLSCWGYAVQRCAVRPLVVFGSAVSACMLCAAVL